MITKQNKRNPRKYGFCSAAARARVHMTVNAKSEIHEYGQAIKDKTKGICLALLYKCRGMHLDISKLHTVGCKIVDGMWRHCGSHHLLCRHLLLARS